MPRYSCIPCPSSYVHNQIIKKNQFSPERFGGGGRNPFVSYFRQAVRFLWHPSVLWLQKDVLSCLEQLCINSFLFVDNVFLHCTICQVFFWHGPFWQLFLFIFVLFIIQRYFMKNSQVNRFLGVLVNAKRTKECYLYDIATIGKKNSIKNSKVHGNHGHKNSRTAKRTGSSCICFAFPSFPHSVGQDCNFSSVWHKKSHFDTISRHWKSKTDAQMTWLFLAVCGVEILWHFPLYNKKCQ